MTLTPCWISFPILNDPPVQFLRIFSWQADEKGGSGGFIPALSRLAKCPRGFAPCSAERLPPFRAKPSNHYHFSPREGAAFPRRKTGYRKGKLPERPSLSTERAAKPQVVPILRIGIWTSLGLPRHHALKSMEIWRDKPAATTLRKTFSSAC